MSLFRTIILVISQSRHNGQPDMCLKFWSLGGFSSPPSFRVPSEWSCPLLGGTTYCADTFVKQAKAFSSSVSWSYATPQVGTGTDGGRGGSAAGAGVVGVWAPAQAASSGPGSLRCHIYWTVDCCCSCPALMAGCEVQAAQSPDAPWLGIQPLQSSVASQK